MLIVLFLSAVFLSEGQSRWRDHFSYRNAKSIAESENFAIVASEMGLMLFDKLNPEVRKLSRVNGLSDVDITAVQALSNDVFIVGYATGNIDLVSEEGTINIPDFKIKNIQGSKRINHFYVDGERVYCSTDYALLVVDVEKNEVTDTYFLGVNSERLIIYQTLVRDEQIYAATDRGLLRASLDNPLIVYDKGWELVSSGYAACVAVDQHGNDLVMAEKANDETRILYGDQYSWNGLVSLRNFQSMRSQAGKLVVAALSFVTVYNENYLIDQVIESYSFDGNLRVQDAIYSPFEDVFFLADRNFGLVEVANGIDISYVANGPYSNHTFDVYASRGVVYSTAGGLTADNNNLNRTIEYSVYNIGQGHWSSYLSSVRGSSSTARDLLRICSSSVNDSLVYMCSWGGGIFEVRGSDAPVHYDENNSGLQDIYPDSRKYVRVGGIASDSEGNIWMMNAGVDAGIVVKSGDDWYQFDYAAANKLHSTGQIMITSSDQVWIPIPRGAIGERQGIMVIDTKGTLLDDDDDEYRSGAAVGYGNDPRNKGVLRLWDENKTEITRTVLSMAEDKNGYIWLGTDQGILVYYRPWAIFSEPYPVASRIKVPRNDGSNLVDYLLEKERISSIAVDGADRKWIGTEDSGLYLVSADGLKTFATFNMSNSPLPSNSITSVAIDPVSGEVFIGTAKGIVSYKAKATQGTDSFSRVYAYPNPVREDFKGDITITGLMENSSVKITTISGKLVYETRSLGGKAYWNGRNYNGKEVKTGVYLIYVASEDGSESDVIKVLIVR